MDTPKSCQMNIFQEWEDHSFIVPDGELIVVQCGSHAYLKRGDGKTPFSQLKYLSEEDLNSRNASKPAPMKASQQKPAEESQSQVIGVESTASYKSTSAGLFCKADAPFSMSLGFNAQTLSADDFSFVWNGDMSKPIFYKYQSHGRGTVNLNPAGGLDGVWIGDQTLKKCIEDEAKKSQAPQIVFVKQTVSPEDGVEIAQVNRCPIYAPKKSTAKVTLKSGGKTVGEFTLDQTSDAVIELPAELSRAAVPEASEASGKQTAELQKQIDSLKSQIEELKKMIPTRTSDLKNDTKFVTSWSIGNGQVTFRKDGKTVGKFTANQTSAVTIDL